MEDRKLSRRRFLAWSGGAVAGTLLAACQPKVIEKQVPVEVTKVVKEVEQVEITPTPAPEAPVNLVIWYGAGGAMLDAAKKAGQAWSEQNPNMPAEVVSTPMGAMQTIEKLMSAIAGGTAPDLAQFWDALLSGRLVSPATLEKMWTPHYSTNSKSGQTCYGYGFWLSRENDMPVTMYLLGEDPGVAFFSGYYPRQKILFSLLGNLVDPAWAMFDCIQESIKTA